MLIRKANTTAAKFASASILSSVISMFSGILAISWVDPNSLGIWHSLTIFTIYISFLDIGVTNGLNRELPFWYGKGNREKGAVLAKTSQSYMASVSILLLAATLIASSYLLFNGYPEKISTGALAVGLIASVSAYQKHLIVTYRSSQSFLSLSKLYVYKAILQLILFPLIIYYNYYGLILYLFLIQALFTMMMHIERPMKVAISFSYVHFKALVKTGMPVFGMGFLRGISNSFNRLILLAVGGTLTVGLFTPVNAVGSVINILPSVLGNYFFPKMNYILGQSDDPKELWPLALKLNGIMMILSVPFVIIVWITTPYLISTFFEKYKESIDAIKFFSINFLFAGALVSHNVIYAVKAYNWGLYFIILELAARFFLPYFAVHVFKGNILTLMSLGVLSSNCLLFFLNLIIIRRVLFGEAKTTISSNEILTR